jgi:hypothetical protein
VLGDESGVKKLAIILGLLVLAGWFFLLPYFPGAPEPGSGLRQDAHCLKVLADGPHAEARTWLSQAKPPEERFVGEQTPKEALAIVERLYSLGAKDVQAADITTSPYGQWTQVLIVTLPTDTQARTALFDFGAHMASRAGFDPVSDDGQQYMFLFKFKASIWQLLQALVGARNV